MPPILASSTAISFFFCLIPPSSTSHQAISLSNTSDPRQLKSHQGFFSSLIPDPRQLQPHLAEPDGDRRRPGRYGAGNLHGRRDAGDGIDGRSGDVAQDVDSQSGCVAEEGGVVGAAVQLVYADGVEGGVLGGELVEDGGPAIAPLRPAVLLLLPRPPPTLAQQKINSPTCNKICYLSHRANRVGVIL